MHRLATTPGSWDGSDDGTLIEQPGAPVLLLSSADTDLRAIAALQEREPQLLAGGLRGLNLACLGHPARIDHYIHTTVRQASVVVVRLLGGRGHWSYGLEQLRGWASGADGVHGLTRQLVVLAGTAEQELELSDLGTVPRDLAVALGRCLREGDEANLRQVLISLSALAAGASADPPPLIPQPDPLPHDWRPDPGARVGVLLYRSLRQAGDLAWMEATLAALRRVGLCPRGLWVSGLRDPAIQRGVADLLQREGVAAVLCGTAFASVSAAEAGLGAPLWDQLGVPVLQMLSSSRGRRQWQTSSIGLAPTDLTLQVALPELDGRITSRIGAFKEVLQTSTDLATALHGYQPDPERLAWIAQLTLGWTRLRQTAPAQRRVALVLANYPNRNGRLANGVGLDTPASVTLMLQWLQQAGYDLGDGGGAMPGSSQALVDALLAGRSNDPESDHRACLTHLPLGDYLAWYGSLPPEGLERLEGMWGRPEQDPQLEPGPDGRPGFPIRGLRFGHVLVLIQPQRGYDLDPARTYHCPDLPPSHGYLAQYLWLRQAFGAQVVVHVGKHGNLEWLPGKGLGLSRHCFPEWALGPLPHLYPFIVNDPGEGAQAKRRAQAVVLDHLTPPLGRAGLHGPLQDLEALLDEYWQACQLGGERVGLLRRQLAERLAAQRLPGLGSIDEGQLDQQIDLADGYLCELKEAQIRIGLHTYGAMPPGPEQAELLACLARAPQPGGPGLTQALAIDLGLELDPWVDPEDAPLPPDDPLRLGRHDRAGVSSLRRVGDAVEILEAMALDLMAAELAQAPLPAPGPCTAALLEQLRCDLLPRFLACGDAEREAFLVGLDGGRIAAGPSGAPTRGRGDVLPTGRNFYSVDLRGLPSEAAWDLGRRSAELLLEQHLQQEGEHLRHLALSVWGTATMRNGGEDIAQALALLGVRPIWDGPSRRLVDLEAIPLGLLGRPRVDVTLRISGLFRDAFPQLVGWMNRATALVAALPEGDDVNPIAAAARREGHAQRVYGSAPGAYGAGLQALIDSGSWSSRADLAEAFLHWSGWRYGQEEGSGGADPGALSAMADRGGLEQRLAAVQVVLHNQDNREHDLFDSDDYYQFQGGLSAAVEQVRGQAPALWFGDHSRAERPRLAPLEREFDKVLRSRVLNPRWIGAMQRHGYKGGFEMAASLDYLFAYDACTDRMPDWAYEGVCDAWLADGSVRRFLEQHNPWALRDMAERLLEAHHRGLWEGASAERCDWLKGLVLSSEALIEGR